ncbi:MAG: carboxylesterase family protein [Methanomicrobiales archaeon]
MVNKKTNAIEATSIPPTTFDYTKDSSDSPGTAPQPDLTVVKTDTGYISGLQQNVLRVYLGIPFAAPPTGDLRWKPPAPVQPWTGIKETKFFSANPFQPPLPRSPPARMSEDCLYLNVWTPAQSANEKLPVMVFFYGGGFAQTAPYGTIEVYNGTTLAKKGVTVVTTNYRLGPLGFLAHPDLDNESAKNVSGNYGILDQVAALQWVQRNIGAFGGDPSRVTIFGQSAGAESIFIHLVSPLSTGLYSQAIIQSGPLLNNDTIIDAVNSKADAEQFGQDYAKSLGISGPDTIAQMRNVSAKDLINAIPWPESSFDRLTPRHFEPTIDGWVLPDYPKNLYLLHREKPVPLMLGTNANEGFTLVADANLTVQEYVAFITSRFGLNAQVILSRYPANSTDEVRIRLSQIMTRYDFANATKFAAGSMADLDRNTYLYRYSYVLPGLNMGAFHGSETFLLFGTTMVHPDPDVAANIVDIWTRFAKTGNPNGGMNVTWPKYTRAEDRYLDINTTLSVLSGY